MLRFRSAFHVSCFLKKRRTFALKAVVIDSLLFSESKTNTITAADTQVDERVTPKHIAVEIEGVTDVLTKYRAKLREKNIFQSTLLKPSQGAGDAHLLQQAKKTLETLSDTSEDSPIGVEMETILKYVTHRGLKLHIAFFNGYSDVDENANKTFLQKALKAKALPLHIIQQVEVNECVDKILSQHKILPNELIIFSSRQDILSQSRIKNILTCRFGLVRPGCLPVTVQLSHHCYCCNIPVHTVYQYPLGFNLLMYISYFLLFPAVLKKIPKKLFPIEQHTWLPTVIAFKVSSRRTMVLLFCSKME